MKRPQDSQTTLDLFSPWDLRRHTSREWWKMHSYNPQVGQLSQSSQELGFNLDIEFRPNPSYDPDRLYIMNTGAFYYIQQINQSTGEVLVYAPFLPDAPWVKDRWYLMDYYNLHPCTMYGFKEQEWRDKHPEKPCPFPILWGKYRDAYNRRHYEWKEREANNL